MAQQTKTSHFLGVLAILACIAQVGCSNEQSGDKIPTFEAADLQQGRAVWMQVCRNCHLLGVAGAPAITDYVAWQPRLARERQTLYEKAILGIGDENGWRMPPRGGNDARRAVDFMIAAVEKLQGR